jgi:hypothetical protein
MPLLPPLLPLPLLLLPLLLLPPHSGAAGRPA